MAWRTPITSAVLTCDANFECFLDSAGSPLIIRPNPREIVHFVFTIASEVGETDDLDWQVLAGHRIINNGIIPAGGVTDASNIGLAAGDSESDDFYMGMYFLMTSGGEIGDMRLIADYDETGGAEERLVILEAALTGAPTALETYDIYHLSQATDGSGTITAETTLTEALPQNAEFATSGYSTLIPRAKSSGSTDAHLALCTFAIDGVDA